MMNEISRLFRQETPSLDVIRFHGTPVEGKPGVYALNGQEYYSAALLDSWKDDNTEEGNFNGES